MQPHLRRALGTALLAAAALPLVACQTDKGATWPAFGKYRLPYENGTTVRVNRDFTTHAPIGRYDLTGHGGGPYVVVAAADGWVRFIVDTNTGHQTGDNNYVWIEHPFPYCQVGGVTWPGKPADYDSTCVPCSGDRCNEWTKYSHMTPFSTTGDAGLSVGDWVTAGTFLGYEDDIGHASGDHLHWEVAKLDRNTPLQNYANGWSWDWSDDGWLAAPNVLPSICGVGVLVAGAEHAAAPCPEFAGQTVMSITLAWTSPTLAPVSLPVSVQISGPDLRGRLTLAAVRLTSPTEFVYGTRRVTVDSLRLIRAATVVVGRDGKGRLPADQLIWSIGTTEAGPDGRRVRSRRDGPIRGVLDVTVTSGRVAFVLDGGAFGVLRGSGALPGVSVPGATSTAP